MLASYRMRNGTSIWRFLKTRLFMYVSNVCWTDLRSQITFSWSREESGKNLLESGPRHSVATKLLPDIVLRNRFGRVTMSLYEA